MTDACKPPLDDRRQKLLQAKVGRLLFWTGPELEDTVGPYDPEVFEAYNRERHRIVRECADLIRSYSEEQISILYQKDSQDPVSREWSNHLYTEISDMVRNEPPWFAGGLGAAKYRADFEHWSKMPHYSVEELLCLSVGIRPNTFTSSEFRDVVKSDSSKLWSSLQFLQRQFHLLKRTFDPNSHDSRVRPQQFLAWADKMGFEAHSEFIAALRKYHSDGTTAPTTTPKKQDKREVDTIAQLFTAIVIESYGYRPKAAKSPIPKEIVDLAATMGIAVSDDTVRKYLRLGARFIPDDWEPPQR